MACQASRGRVIFLCLELFVFATLLCHSARLPEPGVLDNSRQALGTSPEVLEEVEKLLNISQKQTEKTHLHYGRLLIGKNSPWGAALNETKAAEDFMDVETDYQADMGWEEQTMRLDVGPEPDMVAVERLLQMEPKVECTVSSMKLQVQDAASTPEALFFVDRGSRLAPLPLSTLPPSCGYTIRSMQRDLVLVAPYDGCFVVLEDDRYVLPLRWWGIPVRMSCPWRQAASNPPMVTCHAAGMVVKTEWGISLSRIQVNLNGNWEPITKASQRCLFSMVEHPEGVIISVNYAPCLKERDGFYTLKLAGDGEMKITCPALLLEVPEYPQNDSTLQHHPVSSHAPDKSPTAEMLSAPQGPGFSRSSEMANEEQGMETDQSQLAHYLLHPSFLRAHPQSPESPRSAQSVKPRSTPSPVIRSKDQRWQTRDHYSFHSQPYIPETPPSPPSMIQLPAAQLNQKPFLHPPFLQQKRVEQPGSQKQRISYQYVSYYQQPGFEAHHVESSPPHSTYVEKLPEKPPHRPIHEKPHGQEAAGVQQPEAPLIQEHQHGHSYFHPQPGFQSGNKQPVVSPEVQLGHINHRVYNYPKPGDEMPESRVAVPELHAPLLQKTFYPQPQPEIQPFGQIKAIYEPLEIDISLDQEHDPLHTHLNPEIHSFENPAAGSGPHRAEVLQGQVHQPMNLYPRMDVNSQPLGHPQPATEVLGEDHSNCETFNIPIVRKNVSAGANLQSAHPSSYNPPQSQMNHPFNIFYDPRYPQPRMLPHGISINQQVPSATEHQTSTDATITQTHDDDDAVSQIPQLSSPLMPLLNCPPMCLPELPTCCPNIAFHQHLHHIVPVGLGNNNAPLFYLGQPLLPSSAYSGDGLVYASTPHKQTEESKSIQLTTTSYPVFLSPQSLPSVNEEQTYLQPQDGNPGAAHDGNPSKAAKLNEPVSPHSRADSPYPQWLYIPQNEELHTLAESQSPVLYNGPSNTEHQNGPLSAGNADGIFRQSFMPFNGQYSQEQQNKQTATDRSFNKNPMDYKSFMHYERGRELDMVPPHMLQDAPVPAYNFVFPNSSQLKMLARGSNNLTKHERPPNAFYALPLHGPQGGYLIGFNGSSKPYSDVHSIAQNLRNQSNSRLHSPENLNRLLSKQPKWLDEEIPSPIPGNIYMQRLDGDSTSPLSTSALDGPRDSFLPLDPSVDATHLKGDFPESSSDHWKSLTALGTSPNLPPYVRGKMFRRGSTADQQAHVLNAPSRMEHADEKQR